MSEFNLCCGCMNPKDINENGVCRICGYNENAPHLPSYLAPGTVLNDRYFIGKLRTYNGESADYIGFDTITQSKVTVKEYMPDTLCSRGKDSPIINVNTESIAQYKTFMSEFVELNKMLSKMRSLNHIIHVVDMFGDNNTGYVVFSCFEGHTLGEYLKACGGKLSWDDVKKLFPPIFTTLSLVHNAGIIHRGISPENILINDSGEIKLTGFAISDERTANTELAPEIYGGYAAPEQYNSTNWQGTWTDVYGICALLYRVLTGVVPTDSASRMTSDTLEAPSSVDPSVPKNVSGVIMNGLALNSENRIQTVTELVTQLFEQPDLGAVRLSSSSTQTITIPKQRVSAGKPPAQRKSGSSGKKQKPVSRHGAFIVAIAAVLGIGMFFLLITILAMDGGTGSANVPPVSGIYSSEPWTDGETSRTELTLPAQTERAEVSSAASSSGNTIYIMNDLTGKNYDIIAHSSGYNLVFNPVYEYNDTVPRGLIFEQSIPKDENYEDGAEITVKVSKGPKVVTVPEYVSLSRKDYFNLLGEKGIKYEEEEYVTSDVKEGYVVKTSKDPGEEIDLEEGEVLTVYIAKKPPETTTAATEETTAKSKKTKPKETTGELGGIPISEDTAPPATEEREIIISFYD